MYPKSTPLEKLIGIGALLLFVGLGGVVVMDPQTTKYPTLRITAGCSFILGFLLFHGALYTLWDRKRRPIRREKSNSDEVLWIRILAVILWLTILPFAILRVYDYVHHLKQ